MATGPNLPPIPNVEIGENHNWREWFHRLSLVAITKLNNAFASLDFTSSNITSILTRNHNDLQNFQGGTASEYYHLTSAEISTLNDSAGFSSNGHQQFMSGLLMQWGSVTLSTTTANYSFPIPFPNACFSMGISGNSVSSVEAAVPVSTSQFSATASAGTPIMYYIAVGY